MLTKFLPGAWIMVVINWHVNLVTNDSRDNLNPNCLATNFFYKHYRCICIHCDTECVCVCVGGGGGSHLTGYRYKTPKRSAISDHLLLTGHDADLDDFSIISREPNRSTFKLLIRESLLIYKDRPSLNKTIHSLALFNE